MISTYRQYDLDIHAQASKQKIIYKRKFQIVANIVNRRQQGTFTTLKIKYMQG